ncbi:MAG TPA: aldo/keto reductase [Acidimicrobiales bacterium]|nr:aldo/keto reductase [Acidimicrobiales bacterium]
MAPSLFSFPLSLGSWQTIELLDDREGAELFEAAWSAGIRTFDVARYTADNGGLTGDEGATEAAFARFSKLAGIPGDEVAVAGKVWFDRWPGVRPLDEVRGSLERLGRTRYDLVYLESRPPSGTSDLSPARAVEELAAVVEAGLAEEWGLGSWSAEDTTEALSAARSLGLPPPAAFQQPYSVVWRSTLDSDAWRALLAEHPVPVVASAPLAYGLLTGKYGSGEVAGRMAGLWTSEGAEGVRSIIGAYAALAAEAGWDPVHLALAFALDHPAVRAVVFGARNADQLRHNTGVVQRLGPLDPELKARLKTLPSLG